MEYRWIWGEGPGFEDAKAVRQEVFCAEQGFVNEFDELDAKSWHLVGCRRGAAVCTARLYFTADGVVQAGRVAVCAAQRGRHLGAQMMRLLLQKAREVGARQVLIDAQADKTGFYQKQGFCLTGRRGEDEGVPHRQMIYSIGVPCTPMLP